MARPAQKLAPHLPSDVLRMFLDHSTYIFNRTLKLAGQDLIHSAARQIEPSHTNALPHPRIELRTPSRPLRLADLELSYCFEA